MNTDTINATPEGTETTAESVMALEVLSHSQLVDLAKQLRAERDTLKRHEEAQTARIEHLQTVNTELGLDFDRVADRLLQEAIDRDWCSEYDTIVDELNGRLSRCELHRRTTTYNVSFTVEVRNESGLSGLESAIDRALRDNDESECSNFIYEEAY